MESKYSVGDAVRINLPRTEAHGLVGVVTETIYAQHINAETGALVDEWGWGYLVDVDWITGPLFVDERFLNKVDGV